jgi:hypothetical protein
VGKTVGHTLTWTTYGSWLQGDGIAQVVEWKELLGEVKDKSVRIEFQMKDAQLYGFYPAK